MGHAARLFNSVAGETLIGRITPTPEQRAFLQEHWNALVDYVQPRLNWRANRPTSTWLQGSYKYGTLIKPVHPGEEYDVDVGIYFEWDVNEPDTPSPSDLRTWVQDELVEYQQTCDELNAIKAPPLERCSRAIYVHQFHIDTPVYHLDRDQNLRRLACWSDAWELSDPRALYLWFKGAVSEDDRDQLRRLVRYLKAWSALTFRDLPEARPSSVLLTVTTTNAFQDMGAGRLIGLADDDALRQVIVRISERLRVDACVLNPVNVDEDLNRIAAESWGDFLVKLHELRDTADRAAEALDEAAAGLVWSEAFSYLMPLPETDEVEVVDAQTERSLMALPEIDIEVYDRHPRHFVARHRNEVPHVSRGCDLTFRITNPDVIPRFAVIEWTVRNEGSDADTRNDLGHRRAAIGMTVNEESTAYVGRHFMDCVIKVDGQVYAVRRVSVNVRDAVAPVRNHLRPAYVRLRSRRGRRR